MRIAIAGIMHESNTFSAATTDLAQFEEASLTRGEDLLSTWQDAHHEVGGFIEGSRRFGFEPIPILMAWATPGGPVTDEVLDTLVAEIAGRLRRIQVDGLLLALHGAMVTPKHFDADAEVLRRLRAAVGNQLPIFTTLDYHANVTEEMSGLCKALVGYQTYPHVDQRACGLKAAELAVRALRGEIQPVVAVVKPPMVIGLLGQETEREPMRSLLASARKMEQSAGILGMSLMAGFPYADVPGMGPSVIAITDGDLAKATEAAEALSRELWSARHDLMVPCAGAAEAVRLARTAERRPVVLVDLGDNIGGGSPGDSTFLLQQILEQRAQGALVVLCDSEAVGQARNAGVGQSIDLVVGGKTDDLHGDPVSVRGVVRSIHPGTWVEDLPRHGGRRFNDQGPTAVIDLDDSNTVVLNSLRTPPFSLGQLTSLGIDPAHYAMIVVKAAVAYRAAYSPLAPFIIEVDTPGLTAVDPQRFGHVHRRQPMFPWEDENPSTAQRTP